MCYSQFDAVANNVMFYLFVAFRISHLLVQQKTIGEPRFEKVRRIACFGEVPW